MFFSDRLPIRFVVDTWGQDGLWEHVCFLMDVLIAVRRLLPLLSGWSSDWSPVNLQQCPTETSHLLCSDASSKLMKSLRAAVWVGNPDSESVDVLPVLVTELPGTGIKPALPKWLVWLLPGLSARIPAHCCQIAHRACKVPVWAVPWYNFLFLKKERHW